MKLTFSVHTYIHATLSFLNVKYFLTRSKADKKEKEKEKEKVKVKEKEK